MAPRQGRLAECDFVIDLIGELLRAQQQISQGLRDRLISGYRLPPTIWSLIKDGRIQTITIGRKRLLVHSSLLALVAP